MRKKARGLILAALAALPGLAAHAAESVQELFPYTIVGRVVDYDNVAYDASSGIRLYARDEGGTLLAKTEVFTPGGVSAWNFQLNVPVASQRTNGYAAKGTVIGLSAVDGNGNVYSGLLTPEEGTVGQAGGHAVVRLMLAEDSNGNGISDRYEESKEYDMWIAGVPGPFDPAKDYDGDGVSNRDEYLAGTDPFDSGDRLAAKTFGAASSDGTSDDLLEVTFEMNPGRTYAVREAGGLAGTDGSAPEWAKGRFKLNRTDAGTVERVSLPAEKWETRTIYLLKKGPQRFYRIELEQ